MYSKNKNRNKNTNRNMNTNRNKNTNRNMNTNMENLNKAVNEVNDILIRCIDENIDENDHLKDMINQHQHAIKELQKQIEELEFQLTKSSTLPEKKKSFLLTFFDTD